MTNIQKSKIEWCDHSWNVITGCNRDCYYCYAKRMAYRLRGRYGYDQKHPFRPTFHADKLLAPLKVKKPSRIFVSSMGEFFDDGVPQLWRDLMTRVMMKTPQHSYLVLTKQPQNINYRMEEDTPTNMWIGMTLDGKTTKTDDIYELFENACVPVRFLSCEPLLGKIDLPEDLVDWIIIGGQTGAGAVPPRPEWVQHLIYQARDWEKPVFLKDNLNWPVEIKEFPEPRRMY